MWKPDAVASFSHPHRLFSLSPGAGKGRGGRRRSSSSYSLFIVVVSLMRHKEM